MLHIQRDDVDADNVLVVLHGRIAAEWVDLLERECRELGQYRARVVLDLSHVVFISNSGLEALGRLARSGVAITGCSPLISALLEQVGIVVSLTQ